MGNKMKDFFRTFFQKYVNPVFLLFLLLSICLWYVIKLGHTYRAEVPVSVNIEGQRFRVVCMAEGTGYRIFAHRFLRQSDVNLTLRDVQASPSMANQGHYVINPVALQNAISLRNSDLRILSVGDVPEIEMEETE